MPRFCENCGAPLREGVRFCTKCGHQVVWTGSPVNVTPNAPVSKTSIRPKKNKNVTLVACLIAVLVVLVGVLVMMSLPEGGGRDRKHKEIAQETVQENLPENVQAPVRPKPVKAEVYPPGLAFGQAETVGISPERPVAEFGNGVAVDFGTMGFYSEGEMSVKESQVTEMDGYQCKFYDFKVGNSEHVDLPMLVKVSLPLEEGWYAENAMVRTWDGELGAWIPVYSEADPSTGKITFYPEHFSVYSLFVEAGKKKDLSEYENKPLFRYLSDGTPTPNTKVYLDDYALVARIKTRTKSPQQVIASSWLGKSDAKSTQFLLGCNAFGPVTGMSGAMSEGPDGPTMKLIGAAGDISDVSVGGLTLLGEGCGELAEDIGNFGTALTYVQLFTSLYYTGSILETATQNWDALTKMGADYALKKAGMSTGWLAVVYMAYIAGKRMSEEINLAYHLGTKNDIEYAYRQFTFNYVFVDTKTAKVTPRYVPGADKDSWEALNMTSNTGGPGRDVVDVQETEVRLLPINTSSTGDLSSQLALIRTGCELQWSALLNNIANHTSRPTELLYTINNMIDSYCWAFWKLDKRTMQRYLNDQTTSVVSNKKMAEVWKEPTKAEKEAYVAEMKKIIFAANKELIKDLIERSYVTMVNKVYAEAVRMERELNEQLKFTLVDEAVEDFSQSKYADCGLRIRQFEFKGPDDFRFNRKNNFTTTCTKYAWLLTRRGDAFPRYFDMLGNDSIGPQTVEFKFLDPLTTIKLNSELAKKVTKTEYVFDEQYDSQNFLYCESYTTLEDGVNYNCNGGGLVLDIIHDDMFNNAMKDAVRDIRFRINDDGDDFGFSASGSSASSDNYGSSTASISLTVKGSTYNKDGSQLDVKNECTINVTAHYVHQGDYAVTGNLDFTFDLKGETIYWPFFHNLECVCEGPVRITGLVHFKDSDMAGGTVTIDRTIDDLTKGSAYLKFKASKE